MLLCIECEKQPVGEDYCFYCDECAPKAEDRFIAAGGDEFLARLANEAAAREATDE